MQYIRQLPTLVWYLLTQTLHSPSSTIIHEREVAVHALLSVLQHVSTLTHSCNSSDKLSFFPPPSGVFASASEHEQPSGHSLPNIPIFLPLLNNTLPCPHVCRKFPDCHAIFLYDSSLIFFCVSVGRGRSRATTKTKIGHVSFRFFKMPNPSSDTVSAYASVSLCTMEVVRQYAMRRYSSEREVILTHSLHGAESFLRS